MSARTVITGHSRGLGAAIAEQLLERGHDVLALARKRHASLGERHGGRLTQVELDLADVPALLAWLAGGRLHRFLAGADSVLLVNNAGTVQPVAPPGAQGGAAVAHAVALNVTAPLLLTDAFVAATAGCGDRRVVHVSSGAARKAYPGWSVYGAGKAALDHHARGMQEDALAGLRVCSLAPGVIDTDMQTELRAVPLERFPVRERFDALKRDGGLVAPAAAAARLVEHVLGDVFGRQPVADLRELPAS